MIFGGRRAVRAFTLLELIVVLLVVALLAVIAIPTFNLVQERALASSLTSEAEAIARDANAISFSSAVGSVTDDVLQSAVNEAYGEVDAPVASGGTVELSKFSGNRQCRIVIASVNGIAVVGEPACTADGSVPIAALPADPGTIDGSGSGSGPGTGGTGTGTGVVPGGVIPGSDAASPPIVGVSGLQVKAVRGNTSALDVTWARSTEAEVSGYNVYRTNALTGVFELAGITGPAGAAVRLSGLTQGTLYQVRIAAYNAAGEGPVSAAIPGTPIGPPPPLTTLIARSNGAGDGIITWTSPATSANPIAQLALTKDGAPLVTLNSVQVNAGSYTITGLTPGTTYSIAATPTNAVGTAASSTVSVLSLLAPDMVTGISAAPDPASDSSLLVSWNPVAGSPGSPTDGYSVYVQSPDMGAPQLWTVVPAPATEATLTGLTPGVVYDISVAAYNDAAEGVRPAAVSEVPIGDPLPVSALNATLLPAGGVVLTWAISPDPADPSKPITGFDIFVDRTPEASVPAATRTYTVTGLTTGQEYTFTVVPVNGVGSAPVNDPAGELAATPIVVPQSPAWNAASSISTTPTSVTITWNPVSSTPDAPVVGYNVYRSVGAGNFQLVHVANAATTSYTDTDVLPGTSYSYQVAAYNGSGEGARSTSVTGITIQPPTAATITSVSSTSPGAIALTWSTSPTSQRPVDSVTVRACTNSGMSSGCLTPLTPAANATSGNFATATPNTVYYLRVDLTNAAGSTVSTVSTVQVAYAATLNAAYYTCPSGGSLSGSTCTTSVWNPGYYYCPSGGSLYATSQCQVQTVVPVSCPSGYQYNGGDCIMTWTTYSSGSVGGQCSTITKPANWVSWGYNSVTKSCDYTAATYNISVVAPSGGYTQTSYYNASYQAGYYSYPTYNATLNPAYYSCPSGGTLNGTTCRYT